jgi:hypothetical protein
MDDINSLISTAGGGGAAGGIMILLHKFFSDKRMNDLERAQLESERDNARTYATKDDLKNFNDTVSTAFKSIQVQLDRVLDKLDLKADK